MKLSSINFELMSEDEQDALIDTYQNVLNSLKTSFQILVRVREMDIDQYLTEFRAKTSEESEDIYRKQAESYIDFIKSLVSDNKILTRQFYLVLPFAGAGKDFGLVKEQLELNADIAGKGLARMGMQTQRLSSLEVLDLFYSFYAPSQAKRQPLTHKTMQLLEGLQV